MVPLLSFTVVASLKASEIAIGQHEVTHWYVPHMLVLEIFDGIRLVVEGIQIHS